MNNRDNAPVSPGKGPGRIIVGITGLNCAGKGEFISVLKALGYKDYSLSDMIREELQKEGLEPSRENMILHGNAMRRSLGPDILARLVLDKIEQDGCSRAAVDSIRNSAELDSLKAHDGFFLVVVTAPASVRFERAQARARGEQYRDLEEFIETEEREFSRDPAAQQLDAVVAQGDYRLDNSDRLPDMESASRALVKRIEERAARSGERK